MEISSKALHLFLAQVIFLCRGLHPYINGIDHQTFILLPVDSGTLPVQYILLFIIRTQLIILAEKTGWTDLHSGAACE
jgi:hypothetical protein